MATLPRTALGPDVATMLGGRRNARVDLHQLRVRRRSYRKQELGRLGGAARRVQSIDRQRPSLPSFSMSRSVTSRRSTVTSPSCSNRANTRLTVSVASRR